MNPSLTGQLVTDRQASAARRGQAAPSGRRGPPGQAVDEDVEQQLEPFVRVGQRELAGQAVMFGKRFVGSEAM